MFQVQVKMEHLVFQPKNHQNLVEFSYITWFKYLRDQNQVRFKYLTQILLNLNHQFWSENYEEDIDNLNNDIFNWV